MTYEIVQEVGFKDLGRLQAKIAEEYSAKKTAKAMEKALEPVVAVALDRFRGYIRRNHMGPTGNLLAGTVSKTERYEDSGNAVGLVGFRAVVGSPSTLSAGSVRIGPDRAFHAGFLEFGTRNRQTKGAFASSFRRFGPFKMVGQYPPVKTTPAYPKAFFKRANKGQRASTGRVMPLQPIKNSFNESSGAITATVKRTVSRQLRLANKGVAGYL